ncbi:hypothetical protein ABTD60_19185, partial [Acinetobacter baumannii]
MDQQDERVGLKVGEPYICARKACQVSFCFISEVNFHIQNPLPGVSVGVDLHEKRQDLAFS